MSLLQLRRVPRGEIDHELLWLGVSLGTLATVALWFALHLPWPRCVFRMLTGLPCLTCGATRSAVAFFHGDFAAAWQFNPLAFAAICGVILFDLYAVVVLSTGAPRLRLAPVSRQGRYLIAALLLCAAGLNWSYLLTH